MKLEGKTALITGGAVRVGRVLCEALAAAGVRVVIHYHQSAPAARELAQMLRARGAEAWILRANLDSEAACRRTIRRAAELGGGLDILVNNAAVFHKAEFRALTLGGLRAEFMINLFAPMLLMAEFAKVARTGNIINILDRRIAGLDTACVPYLLSKKALAGATALAAYAFAPRIRVNAVAPGSVLVAPAGDRRRTREKAGEIPLQRRATPADVADAVLFLIRNDALTGQVVYVDGGQHLVKAAD